jgi:hypothetical protein
MTQDETYRRLRRSDFLAVRRDLVDDFLHTEEIPARTPFAAYIYSFRSHNILARHGWTDHEFMQANYPMRGNE